MIVPLHGVAAPKEVLRRGLAAFRAPWALNPLLSSLLSRFNIRRLY